MTNYFPSHAGIMPVFEVTPPENKQAHFVIHGEPKSKERPRVSKTGNVYTPKTTRDAEKEIVATYLDKCGDVYFEKTVELRVSFFLGNKRARDGDNMLKLVQDALNGVAYPDDKQIRSVHMTVWNTTKERARTEVSLYEIEDKVEDVSWQEVQGSGEQGTPGAISA